MYAAAVIDEERCNGCRACLQACPEPNAIELLPGAEKCFVVAERCKACGVCISVCPKEAIVVRQITAVEVPPCPSSELR